MTRSPMARAWDCREREMKLERIEAAAGGGGGREEDANAHGDGDGDGDAEVGVVAWRSWWLSARIRSMEVKKGIRGAVSRCTAPGGGGGEPPDVGVGRGEEDIDLEEGRGREERGTPLPDTQPGNIDIYTALLVM